MEFSVPLLQGRLVRRYQRFLVDIELDPGQVPPGETGVDDVGPGPLLITAHTPNTGSLLGCLQPGAGAWVSRSDNPRRRLKYTWELVESEGSLTGVNTVRANTLAAEAITAGRIPELAGYPLLRREVPYGESSRVDILLEGGQDPPLYVEVKNVSLGRGGEAAFPDAVSTRASRHMRELSAQVAQGNRAAVLFVVQRMDCRRFAPADDIDPAYGEALRSAARAGVMVLACWTRISTSRLELAGPLPVVL
ncbi:MAG: DNA/RNA nuclease SfsA [Deltaproteobacteria bacterium]|nr:DNA/RNA nuclease SfsA [Deltaproteobacteria bacterium]